MTRQLGYHGGRSAMYALINMLRPPVPHGAFDGLPGESSQHDFGQVDVRFVSGTRARLRFLASRLTYSRWLAVTLIPDERAETLSRTLFDHLEQFGGIPLLAMFDRPHTLTRRWTAEGTVADWNELVAGMARDLGLGLDVRPTGPRRLSTDHLVEWVKDGFFHAQAFVDQPSVSRRLTEWLQTINSVHASRITGVVPSVALVQERNRLRPIRLSAETLALRAPIVVNPDATVVYETFAFPMPHQAAGLAGTLFLYPDRIQIVAGAFTATFRR